MSRILTIFALPFSHTYFTSVMTDFFERLTNILLYNPSQPLLFNTGLFLFLFIIFLGAYHLLKNKPRAKMILVILFSLYFYYKNSNECVLILAAVCISDFFLAQWMTQLGDKGRRSIVALNVVMNLGMLTYFKYFNLIGQAFTSIISSEFNPIAVMLPAGISFFTFRSISYIVDVYRNQLEPCRKFLNYSFFLTFFPPLLAGPVVRAKDLLPQIAANVNPTREKTSEGIFMVMCGLIKKVVIADYISGNFVDRIFDNPLLYSGFENLMGCIGFTIQLYCDFSGYSDMAIGIALMLGYRFKDNFRAPFKSQNPSEFWNRWHISLSTWLRDYLYIPLGGNRCSKWRHHFNLLATMTLGGLWHGASAMYIFWGAYNGMLLVLHKALKPYWRLPEQIKGHPAIKATNILVTFALMVFGFTFFRASSMTTVGEIFQQIGTNFHLSVAPQFISGYLLIVVAILVGYITHMSPRAWTDAVGRSYAKMPVILQGVVLAGIVFLVIQTRQSELVPFIYLQY